MDSSDLKMDERKDEIRQIEALLVNLQLQNIDGFLAGLGTVDKVSLDNKTVSGLNENKIEFKGTIMQHAVVSGNLEFVNALLQNDISANIGDAGQEPILLAAEYAHHDILGSLMKALKHEHFGVSTPWGENVLHIGA